MTGFGNRQNAFGRIQLRQADPDQQITALIPDDPAGAVQQLLLVLGFNHELVDGTERAIRPVDGLEFDPLLVTFAQCSLTGELQAQDAVGQFVELIIARLEEGSFVRESPQVVRRDLFKFRRKPSQPRADEELVNTRDDDGQEQDERQDCSGQRRGVPDGRFLSLGQIDNDGQPAQLACDSLFDVLQWINHRERVAADLFSLAAEFGLAWQGQMNRGNLARSHQRIDFNGNLQRIEFPHVLRQRGNDQTSHHIDVFSGPFARVLPYRPGTLRRQQAQAR